jgi:transcriptional regulator with XRE-family HTH domain
VTADPKLVLGKNIRKCRVALGISQEKLGELADLDRTYISGIERGQRNVSLVNIVGIARALRIRPKELLQGIK